MTKITAVIGSDASEKLFLERFGELCGDPLFHVRKVSDSCIILFVSDTLIISFHHIVSST